MGRKSVLVTGGNGFIGAALIKKLTERQIGQVRAAVRRPGVTCVGAEPIVVGNIDGATDWCAALAGVNYVVHAAARVHVMREAEADALLAFRKVNVDGSLNLARQAAQAGVKRFVFISSIKVNGEVTAAGAPYRACDLPAPVDAYGLSKLEAEEGLRRVALETGMELVIIRPVLVYGPGVKANFLSMMKWLCRGVPLPFGAIDNRRSLVSLFNLVDLIMVCIEHPLAAGETFLASDGEDVSTTQLLRKLACALGKPARLVPVPASWMRAVAMLIGQGSVAQRVLCSLQVDIEKNRELLGWEPPLSLDQGLKLVAKSFRETHQ
ncbi:SDR family oxidoreductase [Pseudomonas sp. HD6515]|uniref:UDP-glucose 4-epimerase family protein n=1 Tax=Pseudomonas sp. HD6515 TaxID=2856556 RepID=UPI00217E2B7F|nr:SDR family oxidoreductase [Pseudomonas sp. HD6515]UWH25676.1 SDR family oxidoreductase [Pseudomonas sp. HD6515]